MRHLNLLAGTLLLAVLASCSQPPSPDAGPERAGAPPPMPPILEGVEPVAYWRLDEPGETIVARDSSLNRVHATAVGINATDGRVGGAIRFDGQQAHLAAALPNDAAVGAIEAWVRMQAIPGNRQAILTNAGAGMGLIVLAGGQPCAALPGQDGLIHHATGPDALPVGSWCHLVASIDEGNGHLALYLDGKRVADVPFGGLGTIDRQIRIGGNGSSAGLAGDLDEVRLWPRPLTPAEVLGLCAAGRDGRSPRPEMLPDLSFSYRTAPREQPPPITPELEARILAMPAARGQVLRDTGGAPELRVDDRRVALLGGHQMASYYAKDFIHIAPYRDGGMELLVVSVNCGFFHPEAGYPERPHPPFWVGADRFCADGLEPDLWRSLAVHPDAALIVWLWINPYPAFATEHPDAIIRNVNGDPLVVTSHYLRYDAKGPSATQEQYAISFHSEDFIRDGAAMCAELVKAVERTVPGRRVVGYLIGGGQDAQLYDWNPPDYILARDPLTWGDFSPAARKAWGLWLKKRYGSAEAVAAAWGRPVADLAAAPVPTADDLTGKATLHHPVQGRIMIDWNRFAAESRQHMLSAFAAAVKEAASRPVVVGVCGGDSPARKDLAQTAALMRDPGIDFFLHQPAYSQRQPGLLGGFNAHLASHALNGKLFFADLDHPTWLVAGGVKMSIGVISQTSESRGRAADAAMLAAMWRRDVGALAAAGHGALVHPILGGPWMYNDPEVVAEFNFLHDLLSSTRPSPVATPPAGIAWINDERSISWLKGGLANIHGAWMRGQQNELMASGVPFAAYYGQDLEDGRVPAAPLILMQNQLSINPQMAASLKKLQGDGRTLVFLQGTGWEQLASGNPDAVEAATGIRLALRSAAPGVDVEPDPAAMALADTAWAPVGPSALRGVDLLADMPSATTWNPIPDLAAVDGIALAGGTPDDDRGLRIRATFTLAEAGPVSVRVQSDWWSVIEINGQPVVVIDRITPGSADRPVWGKVNLTAGTHRLEGRVVSGSAGFRLGIALNLGEPSIGQLQAYDEDALGITVVDPRATVHGRYRDGKVAFATVDHGTWRSVFVGSWTLASGLVNQLAADAGAWVACPSGLAVVSRGGDLLVVHALRDGPIPITLPTPAALEPIGPGAASATSRSHDLDMRRGETRLYRVN